MRIKPIIGTRARLMPRLRTMRSIASKFSLLVFIGTFTGKSAFIIAKPGSHRTKIMPKAFLR